VAAVAAAKPKRNPHVKRTTLIASALSLAIASFGSLAEDRMQKDPMEHDSMTKPEAKHDSMDKMEKKKDKARRTKPHDNMEHMGKSDAKQ
jgi:pentapeptide MXKDX repeat protein